MTYHTAHGKRGGCSHPVDRVTIVTTGSMHFDGEPWDDYDSILICLDCGKEVMPDQVEESESESEMDFIPI
ncbi:MAG: hypothetical protein ABFD24_09455 [Anaerolineaceae bacterium]